MDLFKCSGEGVFTILSAGGLFHVYHLPWARYHSEYYEKFLHTLFFYFLLLFYLIYLFKLPFA